MPPEATAPASVAAEEGAAAGAGWRHEEVAGASPLWLKLLPLRLRDAGEVDPDPDSAGEALGPERTCA